MTKYIGKRVSYPCSRCGEQFTLNKNCKQEEDGKVYCQKCTNNPMSNSTQNVTEWAGDPMYPRDSTQNCTCIESGYAQTTNHCPVHKNSTQTDWEKKWDKLEKFIYYASAKDFPMDSRKRVCIDAVQAKIMVEELLADARKEGAVLARRTNKKLVEMYIQDIGESIPSELADMALMVSRQEVIRKIMQDVALMREEDGDEGYNRACNEVLATLKEETL